MPPTHPFGQSTAEGVQEARDALRFSPAVGGGPIVVSLPQEFR